MAEKLRLAVVAILLVLVVLVELGKLPDHLLIATVFDNIPAELKALANEWGWMDTEVREQLYAIAWRIVNAQP